MSARYDRLLRIADRLGKASVGSAEADTAIYEALRLTGPVLPYTTDEAAARTLLPPDFEWIDITPAAGWIFAPCRLTGVNTVGMPYPQHGQWGRTMALSRCCSVLQAWAALIKMEEWRPWR